MGRRQRAVPFSVANLAFRTVPASATPSTRVRFSFSGFRPDAPIYGHYVLGGKVAATVLFGRSRGSCGLLTTRARLFPAGHRGSAPTRCSSTTRGATTGTRCRGSCPASRSAARDLRYSVLPRAIARRSIALSYVSSSTPFSSATSFSIRPDVAASLTISAPLS